MTEEPFRVLVPALDRLAADLLPFAQSLVALYGGESVYLGVVEVPEEQSLSESALSVRRRRGVLRKVAESQEGDAARTEVISAYSLERGVRTAVQELEVGLMLLGWRPRRGSMIRTVERLVAAPPCDVAVVKPGVSTAVRRVLLPVRGGPHAELARKVAEAMAARHDAVLVLLHVTVPTWDPLRRATDREFYDVVRRRVTYPRIEEVHIEAEDVEAVLLEQGAQSDLVVVGAAAHDQRSSFLFGRIPETLARRLDGTVIIVKTKEPVTAGTFGLTSEPLVAPEHRNISELVDRWFAENTFHSHEFRNIRYLLDLKERQGKTISLALPTLNEEATIGKIISVIKRQLVERYPLIDELIVIDSSSTDRTVEIAESLGVPVYRHPEILPEHQSYAGKGEALWKSLYVTRGDIVVWIDSDITGIHPKFVYGLLGPLLTRPDIGFVKGFYRRPLNLGGQLMTTGGGRVTELTARPMINLFYPELSGLVQPLAGEMAGRREVLQSIPFFTGYGVETGLLIDILGRFGLRSLAQSDLEYRVHRNQSLLSLSKMAFAIIQVVIQRLSDRERLHLMEELSTSMKLIHYSPTELFLEVKEIREHERPPMDTLPEYRARFMPVSLSTPV